MGDPLEGVGVDLMEMPLTLQGNCYDIVFLYYLLKWEEAYSHADQTSETIARVLADRVIYQLGVPHEVLSDQEANLLSEMIKRFVP